MTAGRPKSTPQVYPLYFLADCGVKGGSSAPSSSSYYAPCEVLSAHHKSRRSPLPPDHSQCAKRVGGDLLSLYQDGASAASKPARSPGLTSRSVYKPTLCQPQVPDPPSAPSAAPKVVFSSSSPKAVHWILTCNITFSSRSEEPLSINQVASSWITSF